MPSEIASAPSRSGDAARAALRAWILTKSKDLEPDLLTDRTELFAERYLRSVHLPELILLLERLRGGPIDVESFGPGDFRDINTLMERFVAPPVEAEEETGVVA